MRNCFLRVDKFILGLILLLPVLTVFSQPAVHLSPKPDWLGNCKPYDKKPALRSVEGGYFFALSERQVHVEKQANYHHYIREIVSETGIQNASEINISFDPTYERLDFHEITIWRNNKPQNRLKLTAFKILADEKELSNFIYQGTYSALCILSDIRKGDRIEYSYTITGRNPIFQNRYSDDFYLQYYQTVAHMYTSLVFSSKRQMSVKAFNELSKPSISEANGLKRYEWEDFQIKPAAYDDNEPGWFDARARVQVSDYTSWAEVNNWALGINPPRITIRGELAAQVKKLKSASGTDKEKYFRNAVRTVQDEVRYMGIEIGQYSHRANNPEKVFEQRYGDCKDKSLLLVSMLRAGGIDAHMALVNSSGGDIGRYLPAHNVFDHAVVVAELNGKQVWVDATMANQRGTGSNIYFPNYGKALILKPGTIALTAIPDSKTGKVQCEENFTIRDEKTPVKFVVKTVYTLNQADRIRDKLASSGIAETERSYLKYYSKTYNKIASKDTLTIIDNEDRNEITTIEKYEISDFFKKDSVSGKYQANFYADVIRDQLPNIGNDVSTPVDVIYPYNEDFTTNIILPGGWDVGDKHNEIIRSAYRFTSDYKTLGDTLALNYKFAYLKSEVSVAALDTFKRDIKTLSDNALSYGISYTPALEKQDADINPLAANIAFLVFLVTGIIAFLIYRNHTPGIVFSYGATFMPLGGWLLVVATGLFLTPVILVVILGDKDYFSMTLWHSFETHKNATVLKLHLIVEVIGYTFQFCFAIFCLILLLNRRDILPKYFIGYLVFLVAFSFVNYLYAGFLLDKFSSGEMIGSLVFKIALTAVCIRYFRTSERVAYTFIVPQPSHNYSYEGPSAGS